MPTLKASTFAIRTSQRTDQKLQKSHQASTHRHDKQWTKQLRQTEGQLVTAGLRNWRFSG